MAVLSKPVLIIAVDFGTTYSGICFSFADDVSALQPSSYLLMPCQPGRKYLVRIFPSSTGIEVESEKVPTRIAYQTEGESVAWGFQILETDERYQEFKLLLDKTRKAHHSGIAERCKEPASLTPSSFITPTKLTIDFLKELLKCLEKSVDDLMGAGSFELIQREYVITVPAIWSEPAKDLTRFCAQKAGMGNVKLITEPEAAMVYALQEMQAGEFTVGDTFMICDAGGGTVDLITYKVTSNDPLRVEEVVQGDGDRCGSAFITRLFGQYILDNHAKLPHWTEKHTATAIECFETRAKRKFEDKDTEVIIKVPGTGDYQKRNIKILKHKVFIPAADVKVMFDQVCPTVLSLIKEQRRRAAAKGVTITGIILVGGFCQSPYLRRYLRNQLTSMDKNIKFIEPKSGWSAIVRGALSRALPILPSHQNFPQITSRFARRFYGITDSRIFDPSTDPESKRYVIRTTMFSHPADCG